MKKAPDVLCFGVGRAESLKSGSPEETRKVLGNKGAGLYEMSRAGLPVPPGFTITTEVCRKFYEERNRRKMVEKLQGRFSPLRFFPKGFSARLERGVRAVEAASGRRLGHPQKPLLVSVRSGAPVSMPGMLDTILNLGLNDKTVEGLAGETENPRFAWDCHRRFIQMFGNVVAGIEKSEFEAVLSSLKARANLKLDSELSTQSLEEAVGIYQKIYREKTGEPFPQEPWDQLWRAVAAVFDSWNNPRAVSYRKIHGIPGNLGTACSVQAMVFGNMGEDSSTGVVFTRDPGTGAKEFFGEFLLNAQGEDVVAGIRTPEPVRKMAKLLPQAFRQLKDVGAKLEKTYSDVQDVEFTVEKGRLYILQTRSAKRSAIAALKTAVDMVRERLITKEEAVLRVEPDVFDQLLRPVFDEAARKESQVLAKGLAAGPGAATGKIVFDADRAVEASKGGPVILVRPETNPDDVHGMIASVGILTGAGGLTSHAAVVGRGLGKVCIVGCETIEISEKEKVIRCNGNVIREGEFLSLDGFAGDVMVGRIPTRPSEIMQVLTGRLPRSQSWLYGYYKTFMEWVDRFRRLGVRANADTPKDAQVARALGAEGIGLCRTEHMFFQEGRIPKMLAMIAAETEQERYRALESLYPLQKEDFKAILKEMKDLPVTVRTLDPPLHEFLPHSLEDAKKWCEGTKLDPHKIWEKAKELREQNPMLGHRGCRLGVTFPEITEMQVRAVLSAACELKKSGVHVLPEIMIPLAGFATEFIHQKATVERAAKATFEQYKTQVPFLIGTMIEVPRAALRAGEIAKEAQFFSFGTNDLTQMAMGFSRDDYGRFIRDYLELKILAADPFSTLDEAGVGELVQMAIRRGKAARRDLKVGICGEHGGDPASIGFFHRAGLEYVSCSPYRVPVARHAAARAALLSKSRN